MRFNLRLLPDPPLTRSFPAVFDGHGGGAAARFLQENLHTLLARELAADAGWCNEGTLGLAPALTSAFHKVDEEVIRWLRSPASGALGTEKLAGSTATVALVRHDRVVVAHVGDSRALLVRAGGKHLEITNDHRPSKSTSAGRAEADRVRATGGWVTDGRVLGLLAISRALGDYEFKGGRDELLKTGEAQGYWQSGEAQGRSLSGPPVIATPDVSEVPLGAAGDADFMIIATDGLWDCCSSARSAAFVRDELKRNGRDAGAAAKALVMHALGRRQGQDNVAIVIILLGEDDIPR